MRHGTRTALLLLFSIMPLTMSAQSGRDLPSASTLKELLEAFNAHDLDRIMSFFAEDCDLYMPRGKEPTGEHYVGKAKVREGLASRFAGIPNVHYGDDRHWIAGNMGVSTWLLTCTTVSGEPISVRGVDLLEFRNGKIVKKDAYWKIVQK